MDATSPPRPTNQLRPVLGVAFGIAVTIGSTIGVGILRVPGEVAALTGSVALTYTVWMFGGLYALLGANYTAELATMMPKAGGPYVYARVAYGEFGGFVVGFSDWVLNTAALAFLAIAFGEYVVALLGGGAGTSVAGAGVLLLFTLLNTRGIRLGSETQKMTSLVKAAALLAFVVACLVAEPDVPVRSPLELEEATRPHPPFTSLALAFQLVLGTYGGWNAAIYFAEEDAAPARQLPRSLFGGVLLVTSIYLLVNAGLLTVLPITAMASSTLPAATAIETIFGTRSGTLVTVLTLLMIVSIINAGFLTMPRTLFAVSRDRLFPRVGARVNAGGTPVVALMMTSATAVVFAATGTFERLLGFYAIVGVLMNLSLIGAVVVLRRRLPTLERPFRTWGYPLTIVVLAAIDLGVLAGLAIADTANVMTAIALLASTYPVYRVVRVPKSPFLDPTLR
jgi:basic amino acid/polyamine antiporter, APA family